MIFVDASFFFAVFSDRDRWHAQALECLNGLKNRGRPSDLFLTTNHVVFETIRWPAARQAMLWRSPRVKSFRLLEARGEIRGGRFVAGFDGEQYALPEAVTLLRSLGKRAEAGRPPLTVSAADPLKFRRILTPDERFSPATRAQCPWLSLTAVRLRCDSDRAVLEVPTSAIDIYS